MTEQIIETEQKCQNKDECIRTFILNLEEKVEEIFEGEELPAPQWRAFYRLIMMLNYYPDEQPKHVTEFEANCIKRLHEAHPSYSIEDLAWIFIRSKSTIHAVLNGKT